MIEPGSIIVLQVMIDSEKNLSMSDLNFSLDFYVERGRGIHYEKDDLIKVVDGGETRYYAIIDSDIVGRGRLLCRAAILEEWQGHRKKVVLTEYTGVSIGEYASLWSYKFRYRYRLRFTTEAGGILKPDADAYIFYGKIVDSISSYNEITEDMLVAPGNTITKVAAGYLGKTGLEVQAGDRMVVIIPAESPLRALKDDGIGGKVAFDTSIMGANGEVSLQVEEKPYKIYGEFLTVGGTLFIYVV